MKFTLLLILTVCAYGFGATPRNEDWAKGLFVAGAFVSFAALTSYLYDPKTKEDTNESHD